MPQREHCPERQLVLRPEENLKYVVLIHVCCGDLMCKYIKLVAIYVQSVGLVGQS